jgi:3-oxoadipate enol-lactonase
MTETIIDGEAFNIIVEGEPEAPTILLAHSLGTNLHLFDRQVAALKPYFRVVRYDLRGHGGSETSPAPYSLARLGQDALAILDALKIDRVDFIGASVGGLVGLWLARYAPARIGRAVLANTAAQIGTTEHWNERIRTVTDSGVGALTPSLIENWFTRSYREQFPDEVRHFEESVAAMSPEGYAGVAAALRDADLRAEIPAITPPVLIVVGRHDPVTPPGVGALLASSIPNAKLVTLEAAHLSAVEAADAFNEAALDFLLTTAEKPVAEAALAPAAPKKPRVSKPRAPKQKAPELTLSEPAVAASPEEPPPVFAPAPVAPVHIAPARKAAVKKRAAKKAAPKKAASKKSAPKKAAPKKALPKKTLPKKAAPQKTAARKATRKTAKKATRKLAVKTRGARKLTVKKSPVRAAAVKKRPVKKLARKISGKSVRKVTKRPVKKSVRKVAKKSSRKLVRGRTGQR